MLQDFLQKYGKELKEENSKVTSLIEDIETRKKENERLVEMLKESIDTSRYSEFSPRKYQYKNEKLISDLDDEMISLDEQLTKAKERKAFLEERYHELSEFLVDEKEYESSKSKENRSKVYLSDRLLSVSGYLLSDPHRAKNEIEAIAKEVKSL